MNTAPRSLNQIDDAWPALADILETLTFRAGLNTNLVILGTTLLGIAGGVVGIFALLRKRSLVADAVSHATLPGIGLAFLIATALGASGRSLPVLLLGAAATGILGIVCIQAIIRFSRLREDAAIGVVLSVFFGAGVVVLSFIQNHASGSAAGLNKFIYGQTAAMSQSDAMLMGAIAAGSILITTLLLKELAIVCFNEPFARVTGWPVTLIDLLMLSLVVIVTVAGLQAVGLILVVAMLIIPPVAARFWTERLWVLVLLAGVIGGASGYLGSAASALLPRKPAGAVIVLTSGVIFLISLLASPTRGVIAGLIRRAAFRLRIASDHALELAVENTTNALNAASLAEIANERGWPACGTMLVRLWLRSSRYVTPSGALTERGVRRGTRVRRNHRLWEQYLISHADIAPSHVDWSVDQVEHVLSKELIGQLELELSNQPSKAES